MQEKILAILLGLLLIGVSIAVSKSWKKHKFLYGIPLLSGLVFEGILSFMLDKDFNWLVAVFFIVLLYGISVLELKSQR